MVTAGSNSPSLRQAPPTPDSTATPRRLLRLGLRNLALPMEPKPALDRDQAAHLLLVDSDPRRDQLDVWRLLGEGFDGDALAQTRETTQGYCALGVIAVSGVAVHDVPQLTV